MAAKKQKLGKGLNAIFGDDIDSFLDDISNNEAKANGSSVELKISEIRPNPYQPRKEFDETGLNELASSIKENGVFQPILVRKSLSGYELVAGERRLRASKLAQKNTIPAIIVDFNDTQMMEISLLENIQRKDLSPIEVAQAYDQLIKKLKYTQEQLAQRVGKSREAITNSLRLLKLPTEVRKMVADNKLSAGHAKVLLSLSDEKKLVELAKRIVNEGLSVREVEKLVNEKPKTSVKKEEKKNPYVEDVRIKLERKYATSVEISKKAITIKYNGTKDLNRVLELLGVLDD